MKKITVIFSILFITFTGTVSAQKNLVDWTAGIDSVATDAQIKEWTFYYGGANDFLTKDRQPKTITTKNHRPVVHDNRILIPAGTKGRIEEIKHILVDSSFVPGGGKVYTYKKVYYLRLEKDGQDIATLPFTAGEKPASANNFHLDLEKGKTFTFNGHFYELSEGSATLKVPAKFLDDFKKVSGYGF